MNEEAVGNKGCKELGLSGSECVEHKIKMFCGILEEVGGDKEKCRMLFDEYRSGQIDSKELARKLRDEFGDEVVDKARKEMGERLYGKN
jgi:hypothetical protein